VVGMAVYTAKAMLHGKGHDVWEMVVGEHPLSIRMDTVRALCRSPTAEPAMRGIAPSAGRPLLRPNLTTKLRRFDICAGPTGTPP
jgi:hypothetical protein